jgi:N-acetylglucosaminyldiphosphoundecaprenol N-acetyl-beta-D-mannosaminyltransferase
MVGVGAAFDFHAGRVKQAPEWMQNAGLEWFFRLLMEPRRLWRRYVLLNPLFVVMWSLQKLRILRYPI